MSLQSALSCASRSKSSVRQVRDLTRNGPRPPSHARRHSLPTRGGLPDTLPASARRVSAPGFRPARPAAQPRRRPARRHHRHSRRPTRAGCSPRCAAPPGRLASMSATGWAEMPLAPALTRATGWPRHTRHTIATAIPMAAGPRALPAGAGCLWRRRLWRGARLARADASPPRAGSAPRRLGPQSPHRAPLCVRGSRAASTTPSCSPPRPAPRLFQLPSRPARRGPACRRAQRRTSGRLLTHGARRAPAAPTS